MIWVNRKLFNHYDELERKIRLESIGITLGLSVIVGLTLSLLKKTNLLSSFNLNDGIGFFGFIGMRYKVALLINKDLLTFSTKSKEILG